MTLHSQSSPATLLRQRARIIRKLEEIAPAEMAELNAVNTAIDEAFKGATRIYAEIRSTGKAVTLCLERSGVPMTKEAIASALLMGGFPDIDPENGPRVIRDSINVMIRRDKLTVFSPREVPRRKHLVGLPAWGGRKPDADEL